MKAHVNGKHWPWPSSVVPRRTGNRQEHHEGTNEVAVGLWLVAKLNGKVLIFFKYNINIDTYIHMIIYSYVYIYTHHIFINTSERLSRLDLKIHEVDHQ
jgi:hypothetical protein